MWCSTCQQEADVRLYSQPKLIGVGREIIYVCIRCDCILGDDDDEEESRAAQAGAAGAMEGDAE